MYRVDALDEVVALEGAPAPDAGAPEPRVEADEREARVTYYDREGGGRIAITFTGLYALSFGPPNDEAFEAHPLADRGLTPYGAFEVERSSWVRELAEANRVHPDHDASAFGQLRHFVLTFHDSTFECVASGVAVAPAV